MNVRVNQPRQQRPIAKINNLSPRRMLHRRPNLDDPLPGNQNFARLQDLPRGNIQQPRRMQHNDVIWFRILRPARTTERENKTQQK